MLPTSNSSCTRCGQNNVLDITHYEFPEQKGLIFECMSCGNNSLRSNVSDAERQRRFALIAAHHLTIISCQFCSKEFPRQDDYRMHLQADHRSSIIPTRLE